MQTPSSRIIDDDDLKTAFSEAREAGKLSDPDQQQSLFMACSPELQPRFYDLLEEALRG